MRRFLLVVNNSARTRHLTHPNTTIITQKRFVTQSSTRPNGQQHRRSTKQQHQHPETIQEVHFTPHISLSASPASVANQGRTLEMTAREDKIDLALDMLAQQHSQYPRAFIDHMLQVLLKSRTLTQTTYMRIFDHAEKHELLDNEQTVAKLLRASFYASTDDNICRVVNGVIRAMKTQYEMNPQESIKHLFPIIVWAMRAGNYFIAETIYKQLSQIGVLFKSAEANILLVTAAKGRRFDFFDMVDRDCKQNGVVFSENDLFSKFVTLVGEQSMYRAYLVFNDLVDRGIGMRHDTITIYLEAINNMGAPQKYKFCVDDMTKRVAANPQILDVRLFSAILNVYGEYKDYEQATHWLDTYLKSVVGEELNSRVVAGYLKAFCATRGVDESLERLAQLEKMYNMRPNRTIYNILLRDCADMSEITHVQRAMKERNISRDQFSYSTIAHLLCEYGQPEKALTLYQNLKSLPGDAPTRLISPHLYSIIVTAFSDNVEVCNGIYQDCLVSNFPINKVLALQLVQSSTDYMESLIGRISNEKEALDMFDRFPDLLKGLLAVLLKRNDSRFVEIRDQLQKAVGTTIHPRLPGDPHRKLTKPKRQQ